MADIFISYSKADRDKVVMLAAYFESEGWTVWWDTNLAVGDAYRDEIMMQLAAARAVIVLWTPTSTKSDFVRAEAGRAKADGKLIPVKDSDVGYHDIPLPFGEMHTEDLSKRELIRAAVVAQLAKPQVQPSAWWVASKTLRYQVLTWVGIVGGAITLFANLQGFLNLADWARWLVTHWHDWTANFWQLVLGWIGLQIPKHWLALLTFAVFAVTSAVGARAFVRMSASHSHRDVRHVLKQCLWMLLALLMFVGGPLLIARISAYYPPLLVLTVYATLLIPTVVLSITARDSRVSSLIFLVELSGFYCLLALTPTTMEPAQGEGRAFHVFATFMSLYIVSPVMLLIAPSPALAKRMTFLTIGTVVLVALNQLSLYAPTIRALLRPPV